MCPLSDRQKADVLRLWLLSVSNGDREDRAECRDVDIAAL